MAVSSCAYLQVVNGSFPTQLISHGFNFLKTSLSSSVKPLLKELQQLPKKVDFSKTMKNTSGKMLDALVDSMSKFVDQPLLPSQKNFAPVKEIGGLVEVTCTEGEIPADFAEGVFLRNGNNPLFGGLKSAVSVFGQSNDTWVEGEGMLHAVHFKKDGDNGSWTISYNNRYVEAETFKLEKRIKNKPCFIPALNGDPAAILAAFLLNTLRFGVVNKHISNTNVFEHSGRFYAIAENYLPLEVDISTLETICEWNVNGAWDRPFTSHPKKAPNSGELVTTGVDAKRPYYVVGIISADGKKLHTVDLKLQRSVLSHDIGVTLKYNVIIDHPLTSHNEYEESLHGWPYEKEGHARIGVMPRYGDAESVKWFEVEPNCTFHFLNCFEEGNEIVVVRGCRALTSIIPGPDPGSNKFEWFSKGFDFDQYPRKGSADDNAEVGFLFSSLYEWRLNMVSGEVEERSLTGTRFFMDFPFINEDYTGLNHKYGYTQVIDSVASSCSGLGKYGSVAKLYLEESNSTPYVEGKCEQLNHKFEDNNFCSGSVFVARHGGMEEDDGWIVTFVHNEETDVTQVCLEGITRRNNGEL